MGIQREGDQGIRYPFSTSHPHCFVNCIASASGVLQEVHRPSTYDDCTTFQRSMHHLPIDIKVSNMIESRLKSYSLTTSMHEATSYLYVAYVASPRDRSLKINEIPVF